MVDPLHNHVLVKKIEREQKTKTGIILTEEVDKTVPKYGEVVALGPDCKFNIKGKVIRYPGHCGLDLGDGLLILKEFDILCVDNDYDQDERI